MKTQSTPGPWVAVPVKCNDRIDQGERRNAVNSPLTHEQWQLLETHAETAHQAMQSLMVELLSMAAKCDDEKLKGKLMDEAKMVGDAQFLPGYYYHVQSEWTGGDSTDPKNTVYREPHFSGERRTVV